MSYAILELHLEAPTASLERQGNQWRARCERCGGHSKGFLRISHALAAQHRHGRVHIAREAGDLTDWLDTFRHPLEVRPQVAAAMSPTSRELVHRSHARCHTGVSAAPDNAPRFAHHAAMAGAA